MGIKLKFSHIYKELKSHIPFTMLGAILGLAFMLFFKNTEHSTKRLFFNFAHPAHVILSAMVTAAMFKLHSKYKNFLIVLIIGWVGAIGVATVSDILIPHFLGTELLGLKMPTHAELHHHDHSDTKPEDHSETCQHNHTENCSSEHGKIHLGFIEEWHIINSAAIIGIMLGYFRPNTKLPHAFHVLISTWASSAYILMTTTEPLGISISIALVIVLFISVWLPCCLSDIIFPLLFVEGDHSAIHCSHIGHHHHEKNKNDK